MLSSQLTLPPKGDMMSPNNHSGITTPEDLARVLVPPTFQLAAGAFDTGLHYQLDQTDDATLAMWIAVGLEATTLACVLDKDPPQAYVGDAVPAPEDLLAMRYRTKPYTELASIAEDMYPELPYPADSKILMGEIRNKMLHTGTTRHAGLVGISLRVVRDVGRWVQQVPLPSHKLRHQPRVLEIERLDQLADGLPAAAKRVAHENVKLLEGALADGHYDDTPSLKPIAERELAECLEIING